jgi:hypothetical protein
MAPIISKTDSGHSSNYSNPDDIFFSYMDKPFRRAMM